MQLRGSEARRHHGVKEVSPRDFTRLTGLIGIVEQRFERLEGAFTDRNCGLNIWDVGE